MVGRQQQQIRDELFGSDDSETSGWTQTLLQPSSLWSLVLLTIEIYLCLELSLLFKEPVLGYARL